MMPMYVQNPAQGAFVVPGALNASAPGASPPTTVQQVPQMTTTGTSASGMVAHEQNGMVYYYDPNQMYVPHPEGYAPQPNYGVGMGGMVAQPSEGFYYQQVATPGNVYYPPQ
jgi:hypothetical protein